MPPPVPDGENFGALPILKDIGIKESEVGERNRMRLEWSRSKAFTRRVAHAPSFGNNDRRRASYLSRWAEFLGVEGGMELPRKEAAEKVLVAIDEQIGDVLAELAAGVDRPESQLSPEFYERLNNRVLYGVWTHVHAVHDIVKVLNARGMAAVEVGDRKLARECIALSMQLGRLVRLEWIYGVLVGNGAERNALLIVQKGMDAGVWTSEDLEWISRQFFYPGARRALQEATEAETIALVRFIGLAKSGETGNVDVANLVGGHSRVKTTLLNLAPDGWYDLDRAALLRLSQPLLDLRGGNEQFREMWIRSQVVEAEITERADSVSPSSYYFRWNKYLASPTCETMELEIWRRLVRTACAIELHQRGKGSLPKTVEELVPEYLAEVPVDPIDGQPLRYRIEEDGTFTLYAMGADGEDNGGRRGNLGWRQEDGTDLVWGRHVW